MEYNSFLLILNVLLYAVTLFFYQKKKQYVGVGTVILSLYLAIAIIGFYAFFEFPFVWNDLTLFPFIYLYGLLMLVSYPLLRINEKAIVSIQVPSKYLIDGLCLVVIAVSVLSFVLSDKSSLFNIASDISTVSDVYSDAQSNVESSGDASDFNLIGILASMIVPLSPFLLFFYLTLTKRNGFIFVGLILSCCLLFISFLSKAQRGELFTLFFAILFLFLFFRSSMNAHVHRISRKILLVFSVLLILFLGIITVGRFGNSDKSSVVYNFMAYYAGQPFLYFNNYGLDPGGCRNGDRTIPLFKRAIGLNPAKNYTERMKKYDNMNMQENVFYTYVGDFTLDFGPIITVFMGLFISLFFRRSLLLTKEGKFHQLLLAYCLYTVCTSGFSLFPFSDTGGNLRLLLYIILYTIFKQDYIYKKRKNEQNNSIVPPSIS